MLITIVGAFYFRNRCETYEDRKYIAIVVIVIFLIMFGGIGGFIKPYFTDMSEVQLTYEDKKYHFRGSGTFVNPNTVLTNEHVVKGCQNLAIADKDNVYLGRLISVLPRDKGDLAFIETPANRKRFAIISNDDVMNRDILIFPNYTSKAGTFDIAKGLVKNRGTRSSYIKDFHQDNIIYLAPKGRKGNSGSPVYNKKGYLVAIHHSGLLEFFKAEGLSTPISVIKKFAQDSNVTLYQLKTNDRDLTKEDNFKDNFAVNILCAY